MTFMIDADNIPEIIINGQKLTNGQTITLLRGMERFASYLQSNGLGNSSHGRSLALTYLSDIEQMSRIIATSKTPLVKCRRAANKNEATHRFPTSIYWGPGYFGDGFRYLCALSDADAMEERSFVAANCDITHLQFRYAPHSHQWHPVQGRQHTSDGLPLVNIEEIIYNYIATQGGVQPDDLNAYLATKGVQIPISMQSTIMGRIFRDYNYIESIRT